MLEKVFIMALGSLMLASIPAAAQTEVYGRHGGWGVYRSDDNDCGMSAGYEDGDSLTIIYNPSSNTAFVSLVVKAATSLEKGQNVSLYVSFLKGRQLDKDWGRVSFLVSKDSDGNSMLIKNFDGRDFLNDIAKSDIFGVSLDDSAERIVGSYDLKGSAVAAEAVRKCAFEAHGLDLNDPFLR